MNNDGSAPHQTPPPLQQSPEKTAATDEQKRSVRGYLRIFVALVAAVLLTSGLALPWKLVPLALGVAAIAVGIVTLVKVVRYNTGPTQVFVTSLGLVASVVMTLGLGLAVATWDSTEKLESCLANALTISAQDECRDQFTTGLLPR
ncbi:hypothetical protein [Arthrobacter sunyaminii]|uniref:Uncharacterized protein n=1 Tax=Arthrobacter sunyaminii TaxID=2816859 RepID=A0A975S754_9MICC|nr:hypothetical protein [Arthrobacter sunyaminii]MBO0908008.1 hypothetical protein [Arthrobacter sunyaminii]QWQ37050.1 hypothetical protein KG104_04450 [Arthrobacter sunyaminii]